MLERDYIPLGNVARNILNEQTQYVSRWLDDPEVANGIRWKGNTSDYHDITIHRDDVDEFVRRVQAKR